MKFEYKNVEVLPDNLTDELEKAGNDGFEFCQCIVLQRVKQQNFQTTMQSIPQMEILYLLIFKKSI